MRYYLIAGEASGDLHGGNLIRAIRERDPQAEVRCWGGEHMQAAGAVLVKHYRDLAFMGFLEVVAHLSTILRNLRFCEQELLQFRPDVVIFIDYPGFNIRMASFAKRQGMRTVYYISPQVWAWKEARVKTLKRSIDRMLVILPFEQDFYRRWGWEVEYVGHPLLKEIDRRRSERLEGKVSLPSSKPLVALLPGSRKQEVRLKLPVMMEVANRFPQCRFVVAQAPGLEDESILPYCRPCPQVEIRKGDTYGLLLEADAALVTSGTATLEAALFGVPEVVCYKGSQLSYWIAKWLVKIKYISLVNLIMDREVVKELIQDRLTADSLAEELSKLLQAAHAARIQSDYTFLRQRLRNEGDASERAAASIVALAGKG